MSSSSTSSPVALLILLLQISGAAVVKETLVIEEWVTNFLRPTANIKGDWPWQTGAERQTPFAIRDDLRANKYLINGSYPGPTIKCFENDTMEITVVNRMFSESTTIHWHGIHMPGTPYMDGARDVTQAPIMPGQNFTYRFSAWPPGTHYYHSHMDALQASKGIRGPFVVQRGLGPEGSDPVKEEFPYDEDLTVFMADEWRDPSVCLKLEGAMPGNDVCADIRHGSFNGQFGNGSSEFPYPLIEVEQGKCYRMRWILGGSNTENFQITTAGHNMTMVSLDGGYDVRPVQVSRFNLHLGERVDVILCADQPPGNYLIHAQYDYACELVKPNKGGVHPPGFHFVPSCDFYAYLHYKGQERFPKDINGTGGGRHPKPVTGPVFDLTDPDGYKVTTPRLPEPELPEPDIQYTVNLGLLGPTYSTPTDEPLRKGRWYMDLQTCGQGAVPNCRNASSPRSWETPTTPLYMTKGTCGKGDIPVVDVPEDRRVVEVVVQNLSPTAHTLHMHGMPFKVINVANFSKWCGMKKIGCFAEPWFLNHCPRHLRLPGDPNHPDIRYGGYWGCGYDPLTDKATRNLAAPLIKDSFQLWQRSWAVIRFEATMPGMWYFHCHETMHLMLGLQMVFNVLPSKQPAVPADVPTSGWCKTLNESAPFSGISGRVVDKDW